jgi:hypothetical protein
MQAMDENVPVEQLMDDLFMPLDTKDPNVEATIMNAGLGVHGVDNANMVQQIYSIMDNLATNALSSSLIDSNVSPS